MDRMAAAKVPCWYRVVAIAALLWEAMGVASYITQVYRVGGATAEQQQLIDAMPAWVTGVFAIAVFTGIAGAVGLLIRRRWAKPLLTVSLIAATIQFGYVFGASRWLELLGPSAAIVPVLILLVGAALVWFASDSDRRGWLT